MDVSVCFHYWCVMLMVLVCFYLIECLSVSLLTIRVVSASSLGSRHSPYRPSLISSSLRPLTLLVLSTYTCLT